MPQEVKLSLLKTMGSTEEALAKAVRDHITNLTVFRKSINKPRPTTHPVVEACIKKVRKGTVDDYEADYIVVDDLPPPTPPPSLEEKKNKLQMQLTQVEFEAKAKILPPRKLRLASVKANIASQIKEGSRTAEQEEDIYSYTKIMEAHAKIELIGAQALSDLDDQTEVTVDSWKLPTFG
jgi:hypothetical protein